MRLSTSLLILLEVRGARQFIINATQFVLKKTNFLYKHDKHAIHKLYYKQNKTKTSINKYAKIIFFLNTFKWQYYRLSMTWVIASIIL